MTPPGSSSAWTPATIALIGALGVGPLREGPHAAGGGARRRVARRDGAHVQGAQRARDALAPLGVGVDHEHRDVLQLVRRGRARARRQPDGEAKLRALAELALGVELAAHQLHEAARDGEPEAGAAVVPGDRWIRLREGLEDRRDALWGDADAGVRHGETEPLARLGGHAQADPPLRRELHRVRQEVHEDLPQPRCVADHARRHLRGDDVHQIDAAGAGRR